MNKISTNSLSASIEITKNVENTLSASIEITKNDTKGLTGEAHFFRVSSNSLLSSVQKTVNTKEKVVSGSIYGTQSEEKELSASIQVTKSDTKELTGEAQFFKTGEITLGSNLLLIATDDISLSSSIQMTKSDTKGLTGEAQFFKTTSNSLSGNMQLFKNSENTLSGDAQFSKSSKNTLRSYIDFSEDYLDRFSYEVTIIDNFSRTTSWELLRTPNGYQKVFKLLPRTRYFFIGNVMPVLKTQDEYSIRLIGIKGIYRNGRPERYTITYTDPTSLPVQVYNEIRVQSSDSPGPEINEGHYATYIIPYKTEYLYYSRKSENSLGAWSVEVFTKDDEVNLGGATILYKHEEKSLLGGLEALWSEQKSLSGYSVIVGEEEILISGAYGLLGKLKMCLYGSVRESYRDSSQWITAHIAEWPQNHLIGNLLITQFLEKPLSGSKAWVRYRGNNLLGALTKESVSTATLIGNIVESEKKELRASILKVNNIVKPLIGTAAQKGEEEITLSGYIPYLIPKILNASIDAIRVSADRLKGAIAYKREEYQTLGGLTSRTSERPLGGRLAITSNKEHFIRGRIAYGRTSDGTTLGGYVVKQVTKILNASIEGTSIAQAELGAWTGAFSKNTLSANLLYSGEETQTLESNISLLGISTRELSGAAGNLIALEGSSLGGRVYKGDTRYLKSSIQSVNRDSSELFGQVAKKETSENELSGNVLGTFNEGNNLNASIEDTYRLPPNRLLGDLESTENITLSLSGSASAIASITIGGLVVKTSGNSLGGYVVKTTENTLGGAREVVSPTGRTLKANVLGNFREGKELQAYLVKQKLEPLSGRLADGKKLDILDFGATAGESINAAPFIIGSVAQRRTTEIGLYGCPGQVISIGAQILPRPTALLLGHISNMEVSGNTIGGTLEQVVNITSPSMGAWLQFSEMDSSTWPEITFFSLVISTKKNEDSDEKCLGGFVQPTFGVMTNPQEFTIEVESSLNRVEVGLEGFLTIVGRHILGLSGHVVQNPENYLGGYIKGDSGFFITLTESEASD